MKLGTTKLRNATVVDQREKTIQMKHLTPPCCEWKKRKKNHDSKVKFTSHYNIQGFVCVSVRMRERE